MKLGFVLLSRVENPIPSTRISVLNMLPYLQWAGFEPSIVFEPHAATETPDVSGVLQRVHEQRCSVVYLQKVHGPSVLALVHSLRDTGVKTVYGVCDLVESEMVLATDATVVVTDYLRSLYPEALQRKIHVVHDGIERPEVEKDYVPSRYSPHNSRLHAVLVTSARLDALPAIGPLPDWLDVTIIGAYPPARPRLQWLREHWWCFSDHAGLGRRRDYLRFHLAPKIHCLPWHPERVYEQMAAADVGIIPIDTSTRTGVGVETPVPAWMVKSENRLTMKMCIGLPVVATPIPSYYPVIRQGENGFLVCSPKEWVRNLAKLRDPVERRRIGHAARASVIERYSKREQARRLVEVFRAVMGNDEGPAVDGLSTLIGSI